MRMPSAVQSLMFERTRMRRLPHVHGRGAGRHGYNNARRCAAQRTSQHEEGTRYASCMCVCLHNACSGSCSQTP